MSDTIALDLGQAINTTYIDGFLGISVDVPGGDASGVGAFSARFPYGTFGRSRDRTVAADNTTQTGATTLFGYQGKDRHAWLLDDPRVWPKLPEASNGTWGAFADTGREDITVMVLDGTTGSFALRVPHSGAGVSRVLVDVETPGAEQILLANGNGCELAVKALETVVGDDGLAQALAKSPSVQAFFAASQVFAGALSTATTIPQIVAAAVAYQGALAAVPPFPTTKLRSE